MVWDLFGAMLERNIVGEINIKKIKCLFLTIFKA